MMTSEKAWPEPYQCEVAITVNYDGESVERRTIPDWPLWGRDSYGRYPGKAGLRQGQCLIKNRQDFANCRPGLTAKQLFQDEVGRIKCMMSKANAQLVGKLD